MVADRAVLFTWPFKILRPDDALPLVGQDWLSSLGVLLAE